MISHGADAGLMLRRALLLVHQDLTPAIEQAGLTSRLYSALTILSRSSPMRLYQLTELLGIRSANCVVLVNDLERRGWIRREKVPDRGRAVTLSLTDQGNRILARVDKEIGTRLDPLRQRLGDQDAELLLQLLHRLLAPQIPRADVNATPNATGSPT